MNRFCKCATCGREGDITTQHWINGVEGTRCPECNTQMNEQRKMKVIYMAHPVSGDVEGNLRRAKLWVRYLEERFPGVAVVASWITECEIWDDDNPVHRANGFARDLAVLERCDELWLVGPRVSSGMALEEDHARQKGLRIRDLTALGWIEPMGLTAILPGG